MTAVLYRDREPGEETDVVDEELPHIHPTVIASDQIVEAMNALDRSAETFTRWPFADLDALTGPMAPGNVWFIAAASGGGKTTFVASIIELWQQLGTRVYVMALETRAHEFRTYLACMAVGLHPGDALSGQLSAMANGPHQRDVIKTALLAQGHEPYVERVMVSGQRAINLAGLATGLKEAKAFGADVVIVDHIDHIQGGNGSNGYADAEAVNNGALRMAQDNGMLLVFTSQLNMSASKGDYLAKYLPPKDEHIAFGSLKRRNATGMIGLYRPVRAKRPDESEKEYAAAIRDARAGTGDIPGSLEPHTMGIVAMKLRNYGAREGMKTLLGVKHGRVISRQERDRYAAKLSEDLQLPWGNG